MNKEIIELATGLQNSNIPELVKLAKAYLELVQEYDAIEEKLLEYTVEFRGDF